MAGFEPATPDPQSYPAVSLQEARKRGRNAQASIDEGHDPAGERHEAKARRTDTIEALAADYLKKHARKHKRSAREHERILDVDVLPHWRQISVRDLTRRDVRALIDRVADRAPIMANRALALVRKMLNFAVDQDWRQQQALVGEPFSAGTVSNRATRADRPSR